MAKRAGVHSQSQNGIALVITLIMISVTLVMAVAFLALARRERVSVSTTTDAASAKLAADAALQAAQSEIMANIFVANTNLYNYSLLVSTNYQNSYGFNPALVKATPPIISPTNVNYDYTSDSSGYSAADLIQNIADLQFLPRAPVYVVTNTQTGGADFRFYLDLNRNGKFDTNGFVTDFNALGNPIGTVWEVGDPEWVGVLARPDTTHSANNQFVGRYAFIAIPIGNTLDINAIHNEALNSAVTSGTGGLLPYQDGYFRNEGVGSWELNLAAFLTDLNTNQWDPLSDPYQYRQNSFANNGRGFEDAFTILTNRYAGFYSSLATAPPNLYAAMINNPIDSFTRGNPMITNTLPIPIFPSSQGVSWWAGSDNTNHFFDMPDELFAVPPYSTSPVIGFTNSLAAAGQGTSTYDRYTYYRLLAQMGTDSDPDAGKMDLNYDNLDPYIYSSGGNLVTNPPSITNLMTWQPLAFFTNAADRMLRAYTTNWFNSNPTNYLTTYYGVFTNFSPGIFNSNIIASIDADTGYGLTNYWVGTNMVPAFGVTNIPVYINGRFVYSAAVNRILQLAANMYDSSTTNFYPTVFRPLFIRDQHNNIFISGYTNLWTDQYGFNTVIDTNDQQLATPYNFYQLTNRITLSSIPTNKVITDASGFVNVYGVPWIIGAKKGLPNFNKFGMQDNIQMWRRLEIQRNGAVADRLSVTNFIMTNQMYELNISNSIGVECWNSYTNIYEPTVYIKVQDILSMWVTNDAGMTVPYFISYFPLTGGAEIDPWPAYEPSADNATAYVIPLLSSFQYLTNSVIYMGTSPPQIVSENQNPGWVNGLGFYNLPQIGLLITNQLQVSMVDSSHHVIDYVQLGGPVTAQNLNSEFQTNSITLSYANMWATNFNANNIPYGVANQITASEGAAPLSYNSTYWTSPAIVQGGTPQQEIDGFCQFLGVQSPFPGASAGTAVGAYYTNNSIVQVPYTPIVTISDYTTYQANDPLVHYLVSDLSFSGTESLVKLNTGITISTGNQTPILSPPYGSKNTRYQPWGAKSAFPTSYSAFNESGYDPDAYDIAYRDSVIWGSYNWDFPTNKYPTVGWLGRVHRGTPWQTVYLKAGNILTNALSGSGTGINTWTFWTGDGQLTYNQYFDAANIAPVQDRLLFDLFTARFSDNAAYGTLSVNQTNLAAWSALFSGVVTLTNISIVPPFATTVPSGVTNAWLVAQPAGIGGMNASVLGMLVTNISNARATYPNGAFAHIGDILSVKALTEQSPFLNWNNINEQINGLDDEAYEWLPQQTLGLMRVSTAPRYLIYCYGQALRPAPNSLVLENNENQFGLCTNYQVVAESAVRAIISVQPQVQIINNTPVTNYTTKVESYSVLPPN